MNSINLVGNQSHAQVSGNGLNANAGTSGGANSQPASTTSFDASMASTVTLACCQSLCDVLTELPLPTAVVDKSPHTRSLITGLNVLPNTRNSLLNDLSTVPHIQQALYMSRQQLQDIMFINTTANTNNNNATTPSPTLSDTGPSMSGPGANVSQSINSNTNSQQQTVQQQPSQLLNELFSRGCFLNSQLHPSITGPAAATNAASSSNIYPQSIANNTVTNSSQSCSSNDLNMTDLHSIEPSIDARHMTELHQNLMNDLINDDCDPMTNPINNNDLASTTSSTQYTDQQHHLHSHQQPQNHSHHIHPQQQQQNHSVFMGTSTVNQPQQHLQQQRNSYPQSNHHQSQQHHYLPQQQQQHVSQTNQSHHHSGSMNYQVKSPDDNYSSLGERVKNRQREAAQKAIQATAAAFGGSISQSHYQQPQQQQQQQQSYQQQYHQQQQQPQTQPSNNSFVTETTIASALNSSRTSNKSKTEDKDWQLTNKKLRSGGLDSAALMKRSINCAAIPKTPAPAPVPVYQPRRYVEHKPQIRSVKYSFTDIDSYSDSLLNHTTVDIVVRFEQIIDQILTNSCNAFDQEEYYGDGENQNDNDYYYNSCQQQQMMSPNNRNNRKKRKSFEMVNHQHVNGMSFNVSIDDDQLKEIMILSAKLKQTNRLMEIERKKLILFLTVLSNQLNIWFTRYKSKSQTQTLNHMDMNHDDEYEENEEERAHYWELCCNASQSALHLMTSTGPNSSGNDSQLSNNDKNTLISLEELLEVVVDFLSNNLSAATHVSTTIGTTSKSKSKSNHQNAQHVHFGASKRHVTRWTQLLQLLFEFINLRTKGSLNDTLILSLTRISMSALFLLQNTAEMQFVSIELLCHVIEEYDKHRYSIVEELLNSLSKIPTKKSHRKDSILTQMLIRITNAFFPVPDQNNQNNNNINTQNIRDQLQKQYKEALMIISGFLSQLIIKCHSSSSNSDVDFKLIFESLLNDLLDNIHSPHSTASILIVQIIIRLLIKYLSPNTSSNNSSGSSSKSTTTTLSARLIAIEYLSIICSKFAQFLAEKDYIVKELTKTFSTLEQDDVKPLRKNKQKEKDKENNENQFITKIWDHLVDYFNSEKLYREKLVLASIWIQDKYYTDNEQRKQQFLTKLNESKLQYDDNSISVIDISTAALCIQYMEFVHFQTNTRMFDISISHVTASLSNTSNTTQRSRAMKCLSNILSSSTIDRATNLLSRNDLQNAMRSALLDASTSVREATVDLIGRFVLQSKDLNLCKRYSELIGDRILDTGISVRKRVIKILRDFCIEFPQYDKCGELSLKIVRRINDDGEGIRRLVVETCRDLWFSYSTNTPIKYKVYSLLHVISTMINDNASMESMQSLFDQLIKQDTMAIAQEICDSTMNDVLIDDINETNKVTHLSAVQCVNMMSQCCPQLMIKHCETLQSLLSLSCETIIEISLRMKVIQTIERILPHIQNPSPSLLTRIEEDLTKNILQSPAIIIQCSVKCLSVLIKNHTKNTKLAIELFCKFQQILYQYKNLLYEGHSEPQLKPKLLRSIFTCGLFAKYFSNNIYEYKNRVRDTFIELIQSQNNDIKCKAILALGFIIESEPKVCLMPNVVEIYTKILRNDDYTDKDNEIFCIQVLNNFRNYLSESIQSDEKAVKTIEWSRESLKSMQSSEEDTPSSSQSEVVQQYLLSILLNALNPILGIRRVACNVIHVIHSGGHVHPMQLVPYLVAMTCDDDYQIRIRADHVLHEIERKYHGFVGIRGRDSVRLSDFFCKKLNYNGYRIQLEKSSASTQDGQNLISISTTSKEICSRLSTLYQVICTNRQGRRAFISTLLRYLDTGESDSNENKEDKNSIFAMIANLEKEISLEFMVENILFFPYTVYDEILYILNQLECISSINCTNVTQFFKEIFIVERPSNFENDSSMSNLNNPIMQARTDQMGQMVYPDMSNITNQHPDQIMFNNSWQSNNLPYQQQQQMTNPYMTQQQQQQPPIQPAPVEQNYLDIEDIDLENEDQLKKFENNIHVNFDLLFKDSENERLTKLTRYLRIVYFSTLLRTLLKEFYLLKDEKINDYNSNDSKTWEKPIHRRQIESEHLKELFNLAKPNIELNESLLLSNDLHNTEKQLLNEWKRFRQVSLNNYDPNFKSTIMSKLFQVGKNVSTTVSTSSSSSTDNKKTILVDDGDNDNCNNNNNNAGQQNLESQTKQQTPKMNSKKSTKPKKKRKRVMEYDDSDSTSYNDDDDEDYREGF